MLAQRAREKAAPAPAPASKKAEGRSRSRRSDSATEAMFKSAARSFGTQLGRQLLRGLMGVLSKGR
jgi:hypothetical protein